MFKKSRDFIFSEKQTCGTLLIVSKGSVSLFHALCRDVPLCAAKRSAIHCCLPLTISIYNKLPKGLSRLDSSLQQGDQLRHLLQELTGGRKPCMASHDMVSTVQKERQFDLACLGTCVSSNFCLFLVFFRVGSL